jgi:hypothetical protein
MKDQRFTFLLVSHQCFFSLPVRHGEATAIDVALVEEEPTPLSLSLPQRKYIFLCSKYSLRKRGKMGAD